MNILAINGSPRGKKGMTWWVLERFIQGMNEAGAEVDTIQLAGKNIKHCTGELACWFKTPGRCIHDDDMELILAAMNNAEALVLATPVYVDGMTGLLKNCIDRMVPLADPHFETREGHMRHPTAGPAPKKIALVSTCGFGELDNFDPLIGHIKAICKNFNATFAGSILRPAAPVIPFATIRHPFKMRSITKAIRAGGMEFVQKGRISEETQEKAAAEIVSKETYLKQANRYFEKMIDKKK
ncbi:MAG: flavodoxin family protein [Pseudomonadota bacterium]